MNEKKLRENYARITGSKQGHYEWAWRFEWKLPDLWIGVFWKHGKFGDFDIWICLIPCVPLHIFRQWFIDE